VEAEMLDDKRVCKTEATRGVKAKYKIMAADALSTTLKASYGASYGAQSHANATTSHNSSHITVVVPRTANRTSRNPNLNPVSNSSLGGSSLNAAADQSSQGK